MSPCSHTEARLRKEKTQQKGGHLWARKRVVTRNHISQHLNLGFPFSKTVRNGFLWFKPHSLWYFVSAAWAKTGSFVCSVIYSTTVSLLGSVEIKSQPLRSLCSKKGQKNQQKLKQYIVWEMVTTIGKIKEEWEARRSGEWLFHAVWSDKARTETRTGSEPWILWRKRILSRGSSVKIWKLTSSGNSRPAKKSGWVVVGGRWVMHRAQ